MEGFDVAILTPAPQLEAVVRAERASPNLLGGIADLATTLADGFWVPSGLRLGYNRDSASEINSCIREYNFGADSCLHSSR